MPLTALTIVISLVATSCSWLFISSRLRSNQSRNTYQARLLAYSFLFSAFYDVCMLLPHFLLFTDYRYFFPTAMAYGFVVGHIFLYIGFLQMLRLTVSMVPRWNNKDPLAIGFGVIAIIAFTAIGVVTMIGGTHPQFNEVTGITTFNLSPLGNAIDAVMGLTTVVPAAILMIVNGIINPAMRTRSLLLGSGMAIEMISGPMIEGSKGGVIFTLGNVISVLGLLTLTLGVAYRMDQKISLAHAQQVPARY